MSAIEPTLVNLLNYTGLVNTPEGEAAINAYNAALKAVQDWVPGNTAATVIQIINDFSTVFSGLPLPATVITLENIISAGIVTVIGVLTANSPAPATPSATASEEETQAMHQANVIHDTNAKVQALVPGFRRSIFTSPAHQYRNAWNKAVKEGHFPPTMEAA